MKVMDTGLGLELAQGKYCQPYHLMSDKNKIRQKLLRK